VTPTNGMTPAEIARTTYTEASPDNHCLHCAYVVGCERVTGPKCSLTGSPVAFLGSCGAFESKERGE
jgi:hypothetical protein